MDASRFDSLARSLTSSRTRRAVAALFGAGLAAPMLGSDDADAKKKKKKRKHKKKTTCAQTCSGGCCTSEHGACIQLAQQSSSQCGTGGAICQSIGCPTRCSASAPCPLGQCCTGSGICGACLAFVTSVKRNGAFGGLAGADAICQSLAGSAGLPGTYLAWLSDTTASPLTRFTKAGVPYTLVDGTPIAQNWADLTSGSLAHTLTLTETGAAISTEFSAEAVWSYTRANGTMKTGSTFHCQNWSSTADFGSLGKPRETDGYWTNDSSSYGTPPCTTAERFYCFQQS